MKENAGILTSQTTIEKLPRTASVAGGETKKGAMIRQTTVKTLPRTASVAGGGRDEGRRLKEKAGVMARETNIKTLPRTKDRHRGGGRDEKAKTNTKWRWHNPQSREGGKCLAENAQQRENKTTCITKKIKQKHTVLCHCTSSQITLAAPPARG